MGTATPHTSGNRSRGFEPRDRVWQHAHALPLGGRKRSPNLFWDDRLERAAQTPSVNIILIDQVSASDIVGPVRAAFKSDGDQCKSGFVGNDDAFDEIEILTVLRILPYECRRTDDVDEICHD